MLFESSLQLQVRGLVTTGIEVEQPVEADALDARNECAGGRVGLQSAACSHTDKGQRAVTGFLSTRLEIDVGQCVKLVHHDVDVVAPDARTQRSDALALVSAGDSMELAVADLAFLTVEMGSDKIDPARVADENNLVSQLLRLEMKMENAAVGVDNQLRLRKDIVFWHDWQCFRLILAS